MLGKGLESLIPPQKDDENAGAVSPKQQDAGDEKSQPALNLGGSPPTDQPTQLIKRELPKRQTRDAIFYIEVLKIKPNPAQPRRNFDEEGIRELACSVREFGFLQPIVVSKIEKETPSGIDVEYQLIAGERRLLAAKMLGLELVPAIVRNVDLEQEKLEMAVIENIQRQDLNPVERAHAFQRLQEGFHLTQREIASRLGKSREVVANTVRLLDLPAYILEAIEKREISESHGRLLLAIPDLGAQRRLFDDILENRLTTRALRARARTAQPEKVKENRELSPELKMIEEKLSAELGAPVAIEERGETKKITITIYSDEELRNIVERLGGESVS